MHAEPVGARRGDHVDEVEHVLVAIEVVEADSVLDRDRQAAGLAHGGHAGRHPLGAPHQAHAEAALLHPAARAADVEVDLVVAPLLGQLGAGGELVGVVPAELQRQRPLDGAEVEVPLAVAVEDRAGGDHLGVEQRPSGQQPHEDAEVPIGVVHHRGHTQRNRLASPRLTHDPPSIRPRPHTVKHQPGARFG